MAGAIRTRHRLHNGGSGGSGWSVSRKKLLNFILSFNFIYLRKIFVVKIKSSVIKSSNLNLNAKEKLSVTCPTPFSKF